MGVDKLFEMILSLPIKERTQLLRRIRENSDLWYELQNLPAELDYPTDMHYLLIFDGGSKGNPGEGYGSYALIRCDTGQQKIERINFPGKITNNQAEYLTLIHALHALLDKIRQSQKDPRDYRIEIRGDSQLVVNQICHRWKANDTRMQSLRDQALAALEQFGDYRILHHPREHSVAVLGH